MRREIDLHEYKRILVDLLIEFDRFCSENKIDYFLLGGTLLGAIRHKGFIPWDDDIDVCMFRKDYERFMLSYKPSRPKYKLLTLENEKRYYYPFAKLVNTETVLVENIRENMEMGAYVDVFPLDNCPGESLDEAKKTLDGMKFYRMLTDLKIITLNKQRPVLKNLFLFVCKIPLLFTSRRRISIAISKKAKKNQNKSSDFVGEIVNNVYGYGEIWRREYFGEGTLVEFEGHFFKAPEKYDAVLTSTYKDYMKLPPIEKRVTNHDFKCWYKKKSKE